MWLLVLNKNYFLRDIDVTSVNTILKKAGDDLNVYVLNLQIV